MAAAVRGRRSVRGLIAVAAVAGVLLGAAAFAVDPLPLGPRAGARADVPVAGDSTPAHPAPPSEPASATPVRATASARPSPTPARPTTGGSPFTERALLQTSEFLQHGWAKAAELSLQKGVVTKPLLPCVRVGSLPQEPVAAYAATYQGLHTQAAEQVVRFASTADARAARDRLVEQVAGCGGATAERRVQVGERHDPDLERISETTWWNVRGAAPDDRMRGVLVLVRVDDRLVALYLHATTTDPAKTTDILPLMRQAGLRLV